MFICVCLCVCVGFFDKTLNVQHEKSKYEYEYGSTAHPVMAPPSIFLYLHFIRWVAWLKLLLINYFNNSIGACVSLGHTSSIYAIYSMRN